MKVDVDQDRLVGIHFLLLFVMVRYGSNLDYAHCVNINCYILSINRNIDRIRKADAGTLER